MAKGKKNKQKSSKKQQAENNNYDKTSSNKSNHRRRESKNASKQNYQYDDDDDDIEFRNQLQESHIIKEMVDDGNCLFRSLSDQLYGDYGKNHDVVRSEVCDYLLEHENSFEGFVVLDEDEENSDEYASSYEEYIDRMKQEGEWGGNPELVAAARFYKRNITLYLAGGAFSIDSGEKKNAGPDLMLSYHENSHYNSVSEINARTKHRTEAHNEKRNLFRGHSDPMIQIDKEAHPKNKKKKKRIVCMWKWKKIQKLLFAGGKKTTKTTTNERKEGYV